MNTKDILNSNNFVFKKKFGQNFLLDQNILNKLFVSKTIKFLYKNAYGNLLTPIWSKYRSRVKRVLLSKIYLT